MNQRTTRIISYLFPTLGNLQWIVAFFGVLILGRRMINADGDLALHLSMGRFILDYGKIPLRDVFSHTLNGQPVAQHKWLSQVIFAFIERSFGLEGVVLLCALVIASAFWLVFKRARAESQALIMVVMVVFLAMFTSTVHWLIRPHVFTFLFLAAWMMLLYQLRKGKLKCWWLLPILMVLWVNLHGGFIAGFLTWAILGLGMGWDALWKNKSSEWVLHKKIWLIYFLSGATSLVASLLNPSGIGLWKMIFTHLGSRYLAEITVEFQSPNFHMIALWPFLIMIGLLVVLMGISEKRFESWLVLNAAAWLILGLYSGRNIPLFAIVSAPLIAQGLDHLVFSTSSRMKLFDRFKRMDDRIQAVDDQLKGYFWPLVSIMVAIVGLALGFRFDIHGQGYNFDPEVFPVRAVDWLEENPQEGEMFNDFVWGGYLQYRLWPEKQVFIDSNSDFYGEDFVRQYMQVITLEDGWEGVLDQYNVTWAILPVDIQAAKAIQSELGWEVIYEDNTAVILRRE